MTGRAHGFATVALLCCLAGSARAEGAASTRVLVQRVQSSEASRALAGALEEAVVLELGKRRGVRVVTAAELEQTLEHAQLASELGCEHADECLAAVHEKLAVQTVVTGRLGKLGERWLLTLAQIDSRTGSVQRRVTVEGADLAELRAQIPGAMDQALGRAAPAPTFRLAPGSEIQLAVMPVQPRGIDEETADALTQILSSELNQIEGVSVISRDDIRAMLDKGQLEAELGCTDSLECIVEVGAALGLSTLVAGTAGRLGAAHVISLRLIDTRKAQVKSRVLESFVGSPLELKNAVKLAAYQLLGLDYGAQKGGLRLSFNVEAGDARVGDRSLRVRNSRLAVPGLDPGRYSLQVTDDDRDYEPFQTDIYITPRADNVQTIRLEKKPTRWYKSWWFWTATGAVLAGSGAASAYLLTRDDAGNGSGTVLIESMP